MLKIGDRVQVTDDPAHDFEIVALCVYGWPEGWVVLRDAKGTTIAPANRCSVIAPLDREVLGAGADHCAGARMLAREVRS